MRPHLIVYRRLIYILDGSQLLFEVAHCLYLQLSHSHYLFRTLHFLCIPSTQTYPLRPETVRLAWPLRGTM